MKNLIQFVEEGFSEYEVVDMTKLFYKNGYVASYNVPYTEAIYKKLGYEQCKYSTIQIHTTTIVTPELRFTKSMLPKSKTRRI